MEVQASALFWLCFGLLVFSGASSILHRGDQRPTGPFLDSPWRAARNHSTCMSAAVVSSYRYTERPLNMATWFSEHRFYVRGARSGTGEYTPSMDNEPDQQESLSIGTLKAEWLELEKV